MTKNQKKKNTNNVTQTQMIERMLFHPLNGGGDDDDYDTFY